MRRELWRLIQDNITGVTILPHHWSLPSPTPKQPIPRLQHQALGAVLAELAEFVALEHAEGFAGVIGAVEVGRRSRGPEPRA